MFNNANVRYGQGFVWLLIALIFISVRLMMRVAAPAPPFVRVQVVAGPRGEPRAEVWLKGATWDSLTRMTEHGKHDEQWTTGVALMRAQGLSPELPSTAK